MKSMRIYDLTRALSPETEVYAGDPKIEMEPLYAMPEQSCNVSRLTMGSHSGTHADAPRHFLSDGASIDALPPEHFIGRALVVRDISDAADRLRGERILILHTGFESPAQIPALKTLYGAFLQSLGIITLATDMASFEPAQWQHRDLLGHGVVLIEGLTGLDALPSDRVFFCAAPLKLLGCDGAPLRAMAWEEMV